MLLVDFLLAMDVALIGVLLLYVVSGNIVCTQCRHRIPWRRFWRQGRGLTCPHCTNQPEVLTTAEMLERMGWKRSDGRDGE